MRITNNQLTRNYLVNANKNLEYYSDSSSKLQSGRAFTRVSENVSGGKKAMRLRTQHYQNAQYQKNINSANERLTIAEENLQEISDSIILVKEQATRAGGVTDDDTLDTIATTVEEIKNTVLQFANAKYVDEYVFGGTNAKSAPFAFDENGDLTYNGTKVSEITKNADGNFVDANGEVVQMTEKTYIDIGLGMVNANDGSIDNNSTYDVSFSGLDCLGFGTSEMTYNDADGNEVTEDLPNNILDICTEMIKALQDNDRSRVQALSDRLSESHNNLLKNTSALGVRTNYLERTMSMLQDEEAELEIMQSDLEGINDTEEIVKMNEYKYAWMLTLQFGSNVLPQSLMDFIK